MFSVSHVEPFKALCCGENTVSSNHVLQCPLVTKVVDLTSAHTASVAACSIVSNGIWKRATLFKVYAQSWHLAITHFNQICYLSWSRKAQSTHPHTCCRRLGANRSVFPCEKCIAWLCFASNKVKPDTGDNRIYFFMCSLEGFSTKLLLFCNYWWNFGYIGYMTTHRVKARRVLSTRVNKMYHESMKRTAKKGFKPLQILATLYQNPIAFHRSDDNYQVF